MKTLKLIQSDSYLRPYASAIEGRYNYAVYQEKKLTGDQKLSEWANGYMYFGLHKANQQWIFREWAPNATAIYIIGDFNGWQKNEAYRLQPVGNGVWEATLPADAMKHEQLYKLLVEWQGGWGERIPSYANRVVQDEQTKLFSAQVWEPVEVKAEKLKVKGAKRRKAGDPLFIYECHIGMSSEEEKVNSYDEFRRGVLPRIAKLGYNCLQIMAIQEHPYYGSFGYHVSNFFAVSSRQGTPEELKHLIADAHAYGMDVIMDIVHSHAVKNELEGLGNFDGTPYQYFHDGPKREHPAWNSLCFNYGKDEVLHFLLSNCKYWLEVYDFDGFRFDGVTSMMYKSHGLGEDFVDYSCYYNGNEDGDAICYLTLANKLIHEVKKNAITIAEDMSGMPGLACPIKDGGMGFDYRLAMGIPDFWIKYIKEVRDEDWKAGHIFYEMTNRRQDEKTISYAESHDQALVGDKTIIFRLCDADMYWHFEHGHANYMVDRGLALHKMIRLITASTINGGYLNFMGNEFGHPEWIDFPREGNGWSYFYCRRQWHLADDTNLRYEFLNNYDKEMISLLNSKKVFKKSPNCRFIDEHKQVMIYERNGLTFVANFSPNNSYEDYYVDVGSSGDYQVIMSTDEKKFGGWDRISKDYIYKAKKQPDGKWKIRLYIPARSGLCLAKVRKAK